MSPRWAEQRRSFRRGVYFVQADVCPHLIKIGCSNDVERRVADLRRSNAVGLQLLGVVAADQPFTVEKSLHLQFAAHRHHGEWFHAEPQLLEYITDNAVALDLVPHRPQLESVIEDVETSQPELEPLRTAEELASFLSVPLTLVRRLTDEGRTPHIVLDGQVRYRFSDVLRAHGHSVKGTQT